MTREEKITKLESIIAKNLMKAGCYGGDQFINPMVKERISIKRIKKLAVITSYLSEENNAESLRRFMAWYTVLEPAYSCSMASLLFAYRNEYAARTPLIFTVTAATCPPIPWLIDQIRLWSAVQITDRDTAYRISIPFSGIPWYRVDSVQNF